MGRSRLVCVLGVGLAAALCLSLGHSTYVGGRAPRVAQRGLASSQAASPVVNRVVAPAPGSASIAWSACAVAGLAASFACGRAARPKKRAAAPRIRVVAQELGGVTALAALPKAAPVAVAPAAPVAVTPAAAPVFAPAATVFIAPAAKPTAVPLAKGLGHAKWEPRAHRQGRSGRHSRGGERRERRRFGARLQAVRAAAEPTFLSYDASKVPTKLQGGLQLRSFPCKAGGREAQKPSKVHTLSTCDFDSQTLKINRMQRLRNPLTEDR